MFSIGFLSLVPTGSASHPDSFEGNRLLLSLLLLLLVLDLNRKILLIGAIFFDLKRKLQRYVLLNSVITSVMALNVFIYWYFLHLFHFS